MKDAEIARKIVNKMYNSHNDKIFHESSFIYKYTNEALNEYKKYLNNKEHVLSVIASGDQIIEMINGDTYNIDCFDISVFPEYFLILKIAGIESLTYEEYIEFFYKKTEIFNRKYENMYFEKIRYNLEKKYRLFWDILFKNASWYITYKSNLFYNPKPFNEHANLSNVVSEEEFNSLKNKIHKVNFNFKIGNITDIYKDYKNEYDLVYLSNIIDYISIEDYKNIIDYFNNILTYVFYYKNYMDYIGSNNILDKLKIEELNDDRGSALLICKKLY